MVPERSVIGSAGTVPRLTELRAIRLRAALSQRDLAALAGMSPTTISDLENDLTEPRPSTIRRLAKALNVEPHQLMSRRER